MIQRKLRCSPIRSGYIFPPMELLSLASVAKRIGRVVFIDAVVEQLSAEEVIDRLQYQRPDMIVFMPGFESL